MQKSNPAVQQPHGPVLCTSFISHANHACLLPPCLQAKTFVTADPNNTVALPGIGSDPVLLQHSSLYSAKLVAQVRGTGTSSQARPMPVLSSV
jgi:hypothetical protein